VASFKQVPIPCEHERASFASHRRAHPSEPSPSPSRHVYVGPALAVSSSEHARVSRGSSSFLHPIVRSSKKLKLVVANCRRNPRVGVLIAFSGVVQIAKLSSCHEHETETSTFFHTLTTPQNPMCSVSHFALSCAHPREPVSAMQALQARRSGVSMSHLLERDNRIEGFLVFHRLLVPPGAEPRRRRDLVVARGQRIPG
jgi:hypothetical protein